MLSERKCDVNILMYTKSETLQGDFDFIFLAKKHISTEMQLAVFMYTLQPSFLCIKCATFHSDTNSVRRKMLLTQFASNQNKGGQKKRIILQVYDFQPKKKVGKKNLSLNNS